MEKPRLEPESQRLKTSKYVGYALEVNAQKAIEKFGRTETRPKPLKKKKTPNNGYSAAYSVDSKLYGGSCE
jgi:hypothetical protein